MPPKDTGPFKHGEKVLVPHTDKYYTAKVKKSEKREDGLWYYLLHYQGWGSQWDEWVEMPGLKKYDAKLVGAEEKEENGKDADAAGPKRKSLTGRKPGEKRRKAADIVPPEVELPSEDVAPAIQLWLPAALKQLLLDEHEAVGGGRRLPPLPRRPSVLDILQLYVDENRKARQAVDLEQQAANGLRVYFDKAVRQCLLYEHEREEYEKVLSGGAVPSSVYGAEHLLRLCAKMPSLVPVTGAPPETYAALQEQLATFAAFLVSRREAFFTPLAKYVPVAHA